MLPLWTSGRGSSNVNVFHMFFLWEESWLSSSNTHTVHMSSSVSAHGECVKNIHPPVSNLSWFVVNISLGFDFWKTFLLNVVFIFCGNYSLFDLLFKKRLSKVFPIRNTNAIYPVRHFEMSHTACLCAVELLQSCSATANIKCTLTAVVDLLFWISWFHSALWSRPIVTYSRCTLPSDSWYWLQLPLTLTLSPVKNWMTSVDIF